MYNTCKVILVLYSLELIINRLVIGKVIILVQGYQARSIDVIHM